MRTVSSPRSTASHAVTSSHRRAFADAAKSASHMGEGCGPIHRSWTRWKRIQGKASCIRSRRASAASWVPPSKYTCTSKGLRSSSVKVLGCGPLGPGAVVVTDANRDARGLKSESTHAEVTRILVSSSQHDGADGVRAQSRLGKGAKAGACRLNIFIDLSGSDEGPCSLLSQLTIAISFRSGRLPQGILLRAWRRRGTRGPPPPPPPPPPLPPTPPPPPLPRHTPPHPPPPP